MSFSESPITLADRIASFKRALTVEDLAPLLGLSEKTIYKMAKAGRIPCFRPDGRSVRFDPAVTAKWARQLY